MIHELFMQMTETVAQYTEHGILGLGNIACGKHISDYCCPIKILQKTKNRADFICEVSPFSLDFRRQTNQFNYGQKYTF